jgi:acyl carrier protein/short-subunit dehydrogenase involved in D-alanine esterification of teichoic acids
LFAALNCPAENTEIAIRGRARYVKGFEKIDFELPAEHTAFKKNATYLITGANGKMGQLLSKFLSDEFEANLILIDVTAEAPDFINELKNNRSKIHFIREDISVGDKIRDRIEQAEKELGAIQGVIHAAAVSDAGMVLKRDQVLDEKVFAAKVTGTHMLNSIVKDKTLDFFVNCSSVSASLAPIGQVAHVAATTYQDAFAASENHRYPVISIEWPAMHTGDQPTITPAEIMKVLSMAIYLKIPTQVISAVDFQSAFKKHYSGFSELKESLIDTIASQVHERPELSTDFILPHTETEKKMTAVLENFFGIKSIGSEDNFFELGADSLNIMKMTALINKVLNEKIAVVTVYKFPTIQTLSEYIDSSKRTDVKESNEELEESVSIMEGTFNLLNKHEYEE